MNAFLYIHTQRLCVPFDKGQILQFLDAIFHLFQIPITYYTVFIKWEGFQLNHEITINQKRKEEAYA